MQLQIQAYGRLISIFWTLLDEGSDVELLLFYTLFYIMSLIVYEDSVLTSTVRSKVREQLVEFSALLEDT